MKPIYRLTEDIGGKKAGEEFVLDIDSDTTFGIINNERVYQLKSWTYKGCTIQIKTNSEIVTPIQ